MVEAGALLIDVRERDEWDQARIPGAEFRPMSAIETWYQELPRQRPIVVYCRTGNRSAAVTSALIQQAGFTDVFNLEGGIVAWSGQALPVEAPA